MTPLIVIASKKCIDWQSFDIPFIKSSVFYSLLKDRETQTRPSLLNLGQYSSEMKTNPGQFSRVKFRYVDMWSTIFSVHPVSS